MGTDQECRGYRLESEYKSNKSGFEPTFFRHCLLTAVCFIQNINAFIVTFPEQVKIYIERAKILKTRTCQVIK